MYAIELTVYICVGGIVPQVELFNNLRVTLNIKYRGGIECVLYSTRSYPFNKSMVFRRK